MIEERATPGITPTEVMQEHLDRYKFALDYVKGKKVLDCASGAGYGSYMLAQTAYDVIGVDISQDAIDYAKNHYQAYNLEFFCHDACNLPFDDSTFDVITSFETLEHIKEYQCFIKECKRVLRPHGLLIISTPNRVVSAILKNEYNQYHLFEMNVVEFSESLFKEFSLIELFGQCDVDTSHQYIKRLYFWIKNKIGIKRALFPKRKLSFPVGHFKDGTEKSIYLVAVCYAA